MERESQENYGTSFAELEGEQQDEILRKFEEKKVKYFTGKNGTSAYALTTQVLAEKEWTPEVVEKRQAFLLEVFKKNWVL